MSYTLTTYLVDLDELRSSVGSKDDELIRSIIASNSDEFDDADDFEEGTEYLPLADALRQLIDGSDLDPREYTQYGYALEEVCRYVGQPAMEWTALRWEGVEAVGLGRWLVEPGLPVPLPPTDDDFPYIGYLTVPQIEPERERVLTLKGSLGDGADGVIRLLDEYEGWLTEAIRRKKGIVLFYG